MQNYWFSGGDPNKSDNVGLMTLVAAPAAE
jgi:hypothetical protein